MRAYLPRAFLCEQNKNTNLLQGYTKKVIFGVTVIFGVFLCFDQSDLFCKYILYLQNKKLDVRYYIIQLWQNTTVENLNINKRHNILKWPVTRQVGIESDGNSQYFFRIHQILTILTNHLTIAHCGPQYTLLYKGVNLLWHQVFDINSCHLVDSLVFDKFLIP